MDRLFLRARRGDERAGRKVWSCLRAYVVGLLRRRCGNDSARAEELASETIYRAFLFREQYRPAKGSIFTWVRRIAYHASVSAWRRGVRMRQLCSTSDLADHCPDPAAVAAELDSERQLQALVNGLDARSRIVVELRLQAAPHTVVADRLGVSVATAWRTARQIREQLEAALAGW
jgi:RNA polymerase sigma factor (sigma-70 family)